MKLYEFLKLTEAKKKWSAKDITPKVIADIKKIVKKVHDDEGCDVTNPNEVAHCWIVAEILENRYGWEKHGGVYLSRSGEPVGDHIWNVLDDGTIIDSTPLQFHEGHDFRVIPPNDPEHNRYRYEWNQDYNPDVDYYHPHPQDDKWTGEYDMDAINRLRKERGQKWWLKEAPLGDVQTVGMDKPLDVPYKKGTSPTNFEPSMPAKDVRMLTSPKYWDVVRKRFEKTPYNINMVFANLNLPALVQTGEHGKSFTREFGSLMSGHSGKIPPRILKSKFGLDVQAQPGAITIVYISNADASRTSMRMTPWIMAHRLAHAVMDAIDNPAEHHPAYDFLQTHFIDDIRIQAALDHHPDDYGMAIHYSIPYEDLMTMKTARTGTMEGGEEPVEMIAQFLIQGKVTLSRVVVKDDKLYLTNGKELPEYTYSVLEMKPLFSEDPEEEAETMNAEIEKVEADTNRMLDEIFSEYEQEGAVFLTP